MLTLYLCEQFLDEDADI